MKNPSASFTIKHFIKEFYKGRNYGKSGHYHWPRPVSNQEAIEIAASHGVMPEEFAKKISPMAGLRNILVHEYIKVNSAIIHQHIQHLEDFYQFEKHIVTYLSSL